MMTNALASSRLPPDGARFVSDRGAASSAHNQSVTLAT